jgi:hypothetical protein
MVGFLLAISGVGSMNAGDYRWDTALESADLNAANVLLPLGAGWNPMRTDIHFGVSANTPSAGQAYALMSGSQYSVQSFFDVFFDITFTDVDPLVNFGGNFQDGAVLRFGNIGPGSLISTYPAIADPNLPNQGLFPPPEFAPYIGFFTVEIPFGADLNANGENDKMKVTVAALSFLDQSRTSITLPDGTVIDNFDAVMDLSGAVVDASQDPPFGPIYLTGPATASSRLVASPTTVPESGSTLLWFAGALAGVFGCHRRSRC